jgi:thiol-disulfide isomerase/thioredoxin
MIRIARIPLQLWSAFVVAGFLFLMPVAPSFAQNVALKQPKIIAVYFHARWCQDCKEMVDILEDIADRYDGRPALGVVFDVTNQTHRSHSEMLAWALGLEELWKQNAGQLGIVYLLDARSKRVLSKFGHEATFEQIIKLVDKFLS